MEAEAEVLGSGRPGGKGSVGQEVSHFNLFLREMALGVYESRVLKRHL